MLTAGELRTFGGLVRWLVRLDGHFSAEEKKAIDNVAEDLGEPSAIWEAIDGAMEQDEEEVRAASKLVTRPEAREAIHAALYEVASADTISKEEWPLFEWLAKEWDLPW